MENILISTEEEEKEVLKVLEKMGYKWNTGDKPTKLNFKGKKKHYFIALLDCKSLVWGDRPRQTGVTAAEFLKEHTRKNCIVIYQKGNETIALNKATGEKAVAICSPDDTYDFNTGARLAFDRLVTPPVKEVKRVANVGEYVKIVKVEIDSNNDYKVGDILFIIATEFLATDKVVRYGTGLGQYLYESEYVVLENYQPPQEEKPAFKPYLTGVANKYGFLGSKTPFKDAIGRALRVGDTVEVYDKDNIYKFEAVVAIASTSGKPIIMGVANKCNPDGTIEGYKIILKRKHEEVANGEKVGVLTYIKEERA